MNNQIIRNIWGIGRNYSEHAKELNNEIPDSPVVFLKAGSCLQASSNQLTFPHWVSDLHYEVEVVLQYDPNLKFKHAYLGIDFTDRNQQQSLQKKSLPWTLAKSFPGAACITPALPTNKIEDLLNMQFSLELNGEERQNSNTKYMVFDVSKIFNYVKETYPVCPDDLIFTGTPSGVGPIKNGDQIKVGCSLDLQHEWTIHQPNTRN